MSASSIVGYVRESEVLLAVAERWPPAEKPRMPIRLGSIPHDFARLRTMPIAR